MSETKAFNKLEFEVKPKEHTILFGNGIHRLVKNEFEWGNCLKTITKNEDILNDYTHAFEDIVLNRKYKDGIVSNECKELYDIFKAVKKRFCINLQNMSKDGSFIKGAKPYFEELINLGVTHYLTTNYDDSIMSVCDFSSVVVPKNLESTYSLQRYANYVINGEEKTLWRIHGQLNNGNSQSVILGYSQYSGYLRKLIDYIVSGKLRDASDSRLTRGKNEDYMFCKLRNKSKEVNSWTDLFFMTNVHIIGFGMNFSELELWEILNRRKQYIEKCKINNSYGNIIENEIHFYGNSESNHDLIVALKAYGVQVHNLDIKASKDDNSRWKYYMNENIKELKKNIANGH